MCHISHHTGIWRKDGVQTIIHSIEHNGVLDTNPSLIEERVDGSFKFRAIDCSHCLTSFQKLNIPTMKCLVFKTLPESDYMLIADI